MDSFCGGGAGGVVPEFPGVGVFRVPAVCKSVGRAGMSRYPFSNLLADAFMCGVAVGEAVSVLFDGVECRVDAIDEKCLHGEYLSVFDGV